MLEMKKNRTDAHLQYPQLETPGEVLGIRLLCGENISSHLDTNAALCAATLDKYCSKDPGCAGRKGSHLGDTDIRYLAKGLKVNITILHVWHQGTTQEVNVGTKEYLGGTGVSTKIILARTGGQQGAAFGHFEPVLSKTEFKGKETMNLEEAKKLLYQHDVQQQGREKRPRGGK